MIFFTNYYGLGAVLKLCLEGEVGEHIGREQEEEDPDNYRPLGKVYHQRMSSRQSQR